MVASLQSHLATFESTSTPSPAPDAAFRTLPSQLTCLAEAISFCTAAETAIPAKTLPTLATSLRERLAVHTSTPLEGHHVLRLKSQALILDLIHYADVVDGLVAARVEDVADWEWSRQLRYYRRRGAAGWVGGGLGGGGAEALGEAEVEVVMAGAGFRYTWEYQGNAPKLVYTPLTDTCFLTLT